MHPNSLTYAEELVAAPGSDIYYALRFAKPSQYATDLSYFALHHELCAIAYTVRDPGTARLKLRWWQTQLSELSNPTAELPAKAAHPIIDLIRTSSGAAEITHDFSGFVAQAKSALETFSFADETSQQAFCQAKYLPLLTLLNKADANPALKAAATFLGLCDVIMGMRLDVRRGAVLIAEPSLKAHALDADSLLNYAAALKTQTADHKAFQALLRMLIAQAQAHYAAYQTAETQQPKAQRSSKLTRAWLRIRHAHLRHFAQTQTNPLTSMVQLSPWYKLWVSYVG